MIVKTVLALGITTFTFVFSIRVSAASTAFEGKLRAGDLIFHRSQSAQSDALREATESEWTHVGILVQRNKKWWVYEAITQVSLTPLDTFIKRGRGGLVQVKRLKSEILNWNSTTELRLAKEFSKFARQPYDIYFEWADDKIYCSELIFKAYFNAFGIEIGAVQIMGDLKTNGPAVQRLIKERLEPAGKTLNLQEPIVTPISQLNSALLETVL